MKKYWVICENEKGDGPGYSFHSRCNAISIAKELTKYYPKVYVQFDTNFGYITIWSNGEKVEI